MRGAAGRRNQRDGGPAAPVPALPHVRSARHRHRRNRSNVCCRTVSGTASSHSATPDRSFGSIRRRPGTRRPRPSPSVPVRAPSGHAGRPVGARQKACPAHREPTASPQGRPSRRPPEERSPGRPQRPSAAPPAPPPFACRPRPRARTNRSPYEPLDRPHVPTVPASSGSGSGSGPVRSDSRILPGSPGHATGAAPPVWEIPPLWDVPAYATYVTHPSYAEPRSTGGPEPIRSPCHRPACHPGRPRRPSRACRR